MVEEKRHHQTPMSAGTRCVVLVGVSGSAPTDLLGGLSRRGVSTAVVSDPAAAMVALARQSAGALVVVEPEEHAWLDDLIQALKSYHPRTVRWGYRSQHPSGIPQLQPLGEYAPVEPDQSQPVQPNGQGQAHRYIVPDPKSPLGRAQAQVPRERVRSLVVKVQGSSDVDEPLISEEELAMLLGPAPEELGGLS